MKMLYVDLVLDTGELVRIECPGKNEDELYENLANSLKLKETWAPCQFDDCKAEFLGMYLDRVNMGRVIGYL